VIQQTVEAFVRTPFEDVTRQSRAIVDQWSEHFQAQCMRRAEALSAEITRGDLTRRDNHTRLARLLESSQTPDEQQLLRVTRGGATLAHAGDLVGTPYADLASDLDFVLDALIADAVSDPGPQSGIVRLGEGLLAYASLGVNAGRGGTPEVVLVGIALQVSLAENLDSIVEAQSSYQRFRLQRRDLVRLYVTLMALIFLAALFVATWLGFYVSRRITGPIQDLAAASREISAGNLDVRVSAEVGDEMGALVEAFNEMASELQESREVITRSTADLRRSNRAVEERRRYIETLLANLSTVVISLDRSGRATTANPASRRILDVNLVAGDEVQRVFHDRGLHALADLLESALTEGDEGVRRDIEIPRPAGTLSVSVQVSPLLGSDGERLGTLIMVEDLTELLQAQKAAAWREIARRIAHEIKNPLTPIQLAAQRLRKKYDENAADLAQVVPEATASIVHEVGALEQLVDEFSKFARMPELRPREVDFAEIVHSVLALYQGLSTIEWQVDLDPDIGAVTLDPQQMRRALINLIDNAVAAMNRQGTVQIAARRRGVDGQLHVEVADNGPGILARDRDKMFSPYFSTKKRGTGLGLAIVHKVISDHGGTIRVESNEPRGARFVIDLPLRKAAHSA
jgi:two-component system nitrogen regulation sensor histidine kinase NtrY